MSEPDPELGDLSNLSRAELEPVLWALEPEDAARAANIRSELASRTWQGLNPYAVTLDTARGPGLPSQAVNRHPAPASPATRP